MAVVRGRQHQHFVHYYLKLHLENKLNTALGPFKMTTTPRINQVFNFSSIGIKVESGAKKKYPQGHLAVLHQTSYNIRAFQDLC